MNRFLFMASPFQNQPFLNMSKISDHDQWLLFQPGKGRGAPRWQPPTNVRWREGEQDHIAKL
jgi:hypothetical protein